MKLRQLVPLAIAALVAASSASALTWRTEAPDLPAGSKVIVVPRGIFDGSIRPGTLRWAYRVYVADAKDIARAIGLGDRVKWADVDEALLEAGAPSPAPKPTPVDDATLRKRIADLESSELAARTELVVLRARLAQIRELTNQ